MKAWSMLHDSVSDLLDPTLSDTRCHANAIYEQLRIAEVLGKEAGQEPRYWRVPWRAALFQLALGSASRMRFCLCGLEYSLAEGGHDGMPKVKAFRACTKFPAFERLRACVLDKMGQVDQLLRIFVHEVEEPLEQLCNPALHNRNYIEKQAEAVLDLVVELNGTNWGVSVESLESDANAQLCVTMCCLSAMAREMRTLCHAIVQALPSPVQRKVRLRRARIDRPLSPYLREARSYADLDDCHA
jgi:hypothetical protein